MTEEILIVLKEAIFILNIGVRSVASSRHPTVQQQLTKMCSEAHMFMGLQHLGEGAPMMSFRMLIPNKGIGELKRIIEDAKGDNKGKSDSVESKIG